MIVTLALVFAVAIVCVIGFIKGIDERKEEKAKEELKPKGQPRDPKTGRFIKRS